MFRKRYQKLAALILAFALAFTVAPLGNGAAFAAGGGVGLDSMTVIDPYIFVDRYTQTYYMYSVNPDAANPGVIASTSDDLATWSAPQPVYAAPDDGWNALEAVMTPEVALYEGKYYLFVTLQNSGVITGSAGRYCTTYQKSVVVAVADSPAGPFVDLDKASPITGNLLYMHRDGTLYVDPDGTPYLVYAHDWIQKIDGNFQAVKLQKNDLSKTAEDQFMLFRASLAAFYVDAEYEGSPGYKQANWEQFAPYMAYNPQLYNTPEGGLVMLWGTEREGKLVVNQAISRTGSLAGPWDQKPILLRDGRSAAMSFIALDGNIMLMCQNADNKAELYDVNSTDNGFVLASHRGDLDGLTVSIADTLAPRIFPPSTRLVETTEASAAVEYTAMAYDNIDGWIGVSYSTPSGSTFTKGEHIVTASATDAAGNTASADFKVIVRDPIVKPAPPAYTTRISTTGGYPLKLPSMGIHDPYIYYDPITEHYILHQGTGRNVWKSQDLINWAGPVTGFTIVSNNLTLANYDAWKNYTFTATVPWNLNSGNWAAEMHYYEGKYYYFTTLHNSRAVPQVALTGENSRTWRGNAWRATIIGVGDSPEGPFTNMHYAAPATPREFMTLDGTFYVDHDGTPWLVYAHEWTQKIDGTMEAIPLISDLTAASGEPLLMFRASLGCPWYEYQPYQNQPQYDNSGGMKYTTIAQKKELSDKQCIDYVTDGPHMWETPNGSLVCLFTTYRDDEYIQAQLISRTGNIAGPWESAPYLDFDDKGHAMVFEDKDGGLKLVMHNNMGSASHNTTSGVHAEICDVVLTDDGFRIVAHRSDLDGQVNVTSYNDTLAPLIYAPANRYASVENGEASAVVNFNAFAMDDKDGWNYTNPDDVTLTYSHASGSAFPVGETVVTLTSEDTKGNVSTKDFSVFVIDKTALKAKIAEAKARPTAGYSAKALGLLDAALFDAQDALDAQYISQAAVGDMIDEIDATYAAMLTAYASITGPASVVTVAGASATYTISADLLSAVSGIELEFEVDGDILSSNDFIAAGGFSMVGTGNYGTPIYWKNAGNIWTGKVTLLNLGAADIFGEVDILDLIFNVREGALGATEVKLNYVTMSYKNGQVATVIVDDTATTILEKYYSPYDLNKDEVIDLNDLTYALQFLNVRAGDPDWDLAQACDLHADGVIDINDLILILANYTVPYYT